MNSAENNYEEVDLSEIRAAALPEEKKPTEKKEVAKQYVPYESDPEGGRSHPNVSLTHSRLSLISKLQLYRDNPKFKKHLHNLIPKDNEFDKYSDEELNEMYKDVRTTINMKFGTSFIKPMVTTTANLMERVAPLFGADLTGYCDALENNEKFDVTIDQLSIDYNDWLIRTPEMRLAYIMFTTAIVVNNENKKKLLEETKKKLDQEANNETIQKLNTL